MVSEGTAFFIGVVFGTVATWLTYDAFRRSNWKLAEMLADSDNIKLHEIENMFLPNIVQVFYKDITDPIYEYDWIEGAQAAEHTTLGKLHKQLLKQQKEREWNLKPSMSDNVLWSSTTKVALTASPEPGVSGTSTETPTSTDQPHTGPLYPKTPKDEQFFSLTSATLEKDSSSSVKLRPPFI